MTRAVKIPGLGNAHAVVVMEGELSEGFFEPLAATVTGSTGAVLRCDMPEGVRIPEWAIDTTQEPFELSKARVRTALAGPLDLATRKLRSQLLDSLRRLESVRVSWDAEQPFCGATIRAEGEAKFFLSRWLVDAGQPDDALRAEFSFRVTGGVNGGPASLRATAALTLALTADIPKLRFGSDDLNFSFPEVDFPDLDLRNPFRATMLDGPCVSRLIERLGQLAQGTGITAEVTCKDVEGSEFVADLSGGTPSCALVKKGENPIQWADPAALLGQLATFDVDFQGTAPTKAAIKRARLALVDGKLVHEGAIQAAVDLPLVAEKEGRLGAFQWRIRNLRTRLEGIATAEDRALVAKLHFERLRVWLTDDPTAALELEVKVELTPSGARLTYLKLIDPTELELLQGVANALARGVRNVATIAANLKGIPTVDLRRLLEILGKFAAAVVRQAYIVGNAIADAANEAGRMIGSMLDAIGEAIKSFLEMLRDFVPDGAPVSDVDVQVTLSLDPFEILQILVLRKASEGAKELEKAGLFLKLHAGWQPGLLIDLSANPGAYVVAAWPGDPAGGKPPLVTLATDLWLESAEKTVTHTPDADPASGARPQSRLIEINAVHEDGASPLVVVVAGVCRGEAVFLRSLPRPPSNATGGLAVADGPPIFQDLGDAIGVDAKFAVDRILPLLGMGETGETEASPSGGFLEKLKSGIGQVVSVKSYSGKFHPKEFEIDGNLELDVKAAGISTTVALKLGLSLKTLRAKLAGPTSLGLASKRIEEDALGLTWIVEQKDDDKRKKNIEVEMFKLGFSGGESFFELGPEARMQLRFGGLSSDGEGVVFNVTTFRVGRRGVDITAQAGDKSVRLNGLDVPFRFTSGKFVMRASRLVEASVTGRGALPPALIGEADCTLALAFVQGADGIELQSGKVEIDKKGEPIVCHSTRFTLTVNDLDVGIQKDAGAWHFYFLVTGSLRFTPKAGEFEGGLLGFLKDIEINLERAPLTGDARVLSKHVSFQKALSPKKTFNLFNLFTFELRGFGFHPASPRFDGKPAINLSGQIKFAEIGDVMQPKIDFHGLWIAPPKDGEALPRISAEGLGLDLQLAGAIKIRGSVLAVDPSTRTVEGRDFAPLGYDTYGFLGEGEVDIPGWGSMQASLGFLEVEKKATGDRYKAFFVYLQKDKLAVQIPTGFWTFYMREAGFGFGFRYTLAGIRDADTATSPAQLIRVLDDVSRRQGDLARYAAWSPDTNPEANRFTLALRAAVQAYPAQKVYNDAREEKAENPFFFDVIVALRSDLTLLASMRGYLGVNYADFRANKDNFRERPGLQGYLYISAPRQELLARMIANSRGFIGERFPGLQTGQILRRAVESVDWSSTLYIRPGLFHYEMGWPDQLSVRLVDTNNMKVSLRGGMIFRAAEDGLLWGYNIEADAWLRFGGSVGSDIGVAAEASMQARFVARLIAYLSWRLQGSLVYGLVSLDATLAFSVRAWMKINLRFTSFMIRIGFSFSVHFSAAIELAVGTDGVGGRADARISVSVFGCSLGVFVGFSFNDGALESARARVQRFMAMSITADEPAQTPIEQAKTGERLANEAADRKEASTVLQPAGQSTQPVVDAAGNPSIEYPKGTGRTIGPTNFWLVMHASAGCIDKACALLVPREASADEFGGFYAAPQRNTPIAHTLYVSPTIPPEILEDVRILDAQGNLHVLVIGANPTKANWEAPIPMDEGGQPYSLGDLCDQCFITNVRWDDGGSGPVSVSWGWQEPKGLRVSGKHEKPQGTERERNLHRDTLQKQQALVAMQRPADERAYQGRSTVMTMFLDQFVSFAMQGKRPDDHAHVLDLGLMFTGSSQNLERLADYLEVQKAEVDPAAANGKVEALNPMDTWFTRQDPVFAQPRSEIGATGPRLDWDLSLPGGLKGVDPDHFLLQYEIVRTIESIEFTPHVMRVKPASTMGGVRGDAVQLLKPDWQFVDDLADLGEDWRHALLPPRNEQEALRAAHAWMKLALDADVTITYSVTPVDIAGTRGLPRSFALTVDKPRPAVRPAKAEIRVVQDVRGMQPHQEKDTTPNDLQVFVGLDDSAWGGDNPITIDGIQYEVKREYRLYVEHENVLPAGSFGSDGLTDRLRGFGGERAVALAIERAMAESGNLSQITFSSKDLVDARGDASGKPFAEYIQSVVEADAAERNRLPLWTRLGGASVEGTHAVYPGLLRALWAENGERIASRLWLRTEIAFYGTSGSEAYRLASLPVEMPLSLAIRNSPKTKPAVPVQTLAVLQPQSFEWPVDLRFPPLQQGHVRVHTGFLHVMAPQGRATLAQWAASKLPDAVNMLRDPARRTLTVLEFDAMPALQPGVAQLHRSSVAGYDVHALDLDDLAPLDSAPGDLGSVRSAWMRARRVAHVKLLSEDAAGLTPATNADWLGWQASYPSETWRAKPGTHRNQVRSGWYSASESLPQFATRLPRLRLFPHTVDTWVDELLLGGQPERITAQMTVMAGSRAMTTLEGSEELGPVTAETLVPLQQVPWSNATPGQFLCASGARFNAACLRYLLLCLCRPVFKDKQRKAIAAWQQDVRALEGLSLVVSASIGGKDTASVSIPLQFDSPLHGVLEETIAQLSWAVRETDRGFPALYRRYAVTVQAPPAVDARDLGQYLNATASSTDPYGWGVLQGLGCATTIRLFDLTKARHERPTVLAERCNEVLSSVIKRWLAAMSEESPDGVLGQPFAEVMLRPGANCVVRSFDGLAGRAEAALPTSIDDRALSMIQLSLRPKPTQGWQYLALAIPAMDGERFNPPIPPQAKVRQLVVELDLMADDVVDLAIAGQTATTRLDKPGKCNLAVAQSMSRVRGPGGFTAPAVTLFIRRESGRKGLQNIVIRYRAMTEETVEAPDELVSPRPSRVGQSVLEMPQGDAAVITNLEAPGDGEDGFGYEPYGFFEPQGADVWVARTAVTPTRPEFDAVRSLREQLLAVAPEMTLPQTQAEWKTVMPQYLEWMRRFLDHAAAPPLGGIKSSDISLAVAAPSRVSPYEVAPDAAGCVTLTIPGDDKLAHATAYAVRPVSRYAHVLAGAGGTAQEVTERLLDKTRPPDEKVGYAVAVLPRTERIEPPVILGSGIVEGQWELVLGRHAEEAMAHWNRPLFARLGKPATLVTQLRTYRTPRWPERLERLGAGGTVSLYPERKAERPPVRPEWENPDDDPVPISHGELRRLSAARLGTLAREHPGLWKGAEVLAFTTPPPQYRMAALAVARGGIVLSEISTVVQDDFPREPLVPALEEAGAALAPALSITRENGAMVLKLSYRLVSHHDLTPSGAREWETGANADIAWWPDPDVVYNVIHRRRVGKSLVDEEVAEIRLVAEAPSGRDAKDAGAVVTRTRGGRWTVSDAIEPRVKRSDSQTRANFHLTLGFGLDPGGASSGVDTLGLTEEETTHAAFAELVDACRPFATVVDGLMTITGLPTEAEAEVLAEVAHPLAEKDSRVWQSLVRRTKAGADSLILRAVDGRAGAGIDADGLPVPPSVALIEIEWPKFVNKLVS